MSLYAVIDTNVLVFAMLKLNSTPYNIFQYVDNGVITPIVNEKIIDEHWEVLSRPKFHFDHNSIESFVLTILQRAVFVHGEALDEVLPAPQRSGLF